MIKLKLQPIEEACGDCPFYKLTTKKKQVCTFKQLTTPNAAMSLMESSDHYDTDIWDTDCNGSYDKCVFLPLLYLTDEQEENKQEEISTYDTEDFDDFDPYETDRKNTSTNLDKEDSIKEEDLVVEPEEITLPSCKVFIKKVATPFKVNADVLIMPANSMLEVDDFDLNMLSNGYIQRQCDVIARDQKIQMGSVYITTNGSVKHHPSGVAPKHIYHAVVAGPRRGVSERDIKLAMGKALEMAERQGMETVLVYPFDYGAYDIHATAIAQLSVIYAFTTVNTLKNIKNIFIVMEDEDSYTLFKEYYKRVFKKRE